MNRLFFACLFTIALISGCTRAPIFVPPDQQEVIDRKLVEYPAGVELVEVAKNLNGPVDVDVDDEGTLIVAESGAGGDNPRIFGHREDGSTFFIYPTGRGLPLGPFERGFRIHGPIGGIAVDHGKVYVSHRDDKGFGVITAFKYDGTHSTVVGDLPAQGDNSVTDVAISPRDGRLWFGVGSATNSGVVGLDNWYWVRKYPKFCDIPYIDMRVQGYRFDSKNPNAGLFGGSELAVTAPFQPFSVSNKTWIRRAENGRPTAAIYSVDVQGGTPRVVAHGIHNPRGIGFDKFDVPFMTNDGMELRGTRPIKDDPDAFLRIVQDTWYGWPDFTTDLHPVTDAQFQPPQQLAIQHGYPDVSFLFDHNASNPPAGLINPLRGALVQGVFPSLSGAAKFDFIPEKGPLGTPENRGKVVVALSGDRAPFANSGMKLLEPVGFKVVRLNPETGDVENFVRNTKAKPASMLSGGDGVLERPIAVKFTKSGDMYIVDYGRIEMHGGREEAKARTGKIFLLRAPVDRTSETASN